MYRERYWDEMPVCLRARRTSLADRLSSDSAWKLSLLCTTCAISPFNILRQRWNEDTTIIISWAWRKYHPRPKLPWRRIWGGVYRGPARLLQAEKRGVGEGGESKKDPRRSNQRPGKAKGTLLTLETLHWILIYNMLSLLLSHKTPLSQPFAIRVNA